jgi:hypothetical protein
MSGVDQLLWLDTRSKPRIVGSNLELQGGSGPGTEQEEEALQFRGSLSLGALEGRLPKQDMCSPNVPVACSSSAPPNPSKEGQPLRPVIHDRVSTMKEMGTALAILRATPPWARVCIPLRPGEPARPWKCWRQFRRGSGNQLFRKASP